MSNHELTVSSSSPSRFSLVLLEPGEIYFEDYLVYYHETRNPLNSSGDDTTTTSEPIKGNLKICSKSVVFDPINFSYPLVKFSYKSIDLIELFNEEDNSKKNDDEYDDLYTIRPSTEKNNGLKQKCFAISCKQTINCKVNNKIAPYVLKKSENKSCKYYFELIFTNVNDSLDLLMQLHRASTLEYEDEDVMQQLILKSRLKRDFNFDVHQFEDLSKEQVQFEAIVNKINPLVANPGKIILTNMCLYYKPFNNLLEDNQTTNVFKIRLKQIKYVIKRRYHLKRVGCEIIFDNLSSSMSDSSSSSSSKRLPYLYLTFEDEATRDQFYTRLTVDQASKLSNLEEFNQENMLQRWRYGAISNFDYLMYLNNMADRSYNDLTQYPVFPWVLNDYSSAELDLTNPKSFRDLSKPIGALNEERLARLRQRYFEMKVQTTQFGSSRTANQEEQPTFLYGSHYSTPAFVLFYLVRQHPEWQLCLQNGRFDHPNRLFHSIEDTWRNCLTIDSDVKELLPEFYDLGDYNRLGHDQERNLESRLSASSVGAFLRNDLELELGVRSDGVRVNHVILPKWAHNSTCEFIVKMRDALESPHVSENLHKWIDLIFGYKQTGQEAIDANNLFYYLCYEGAVDLNSISDYSQRKSLEIQIQEFGQIPTQLFKTPHLPKAKQIGELVDLEYLSSPSALATSSSTNQSRSSPSTTTVPSSSNTEAVVVQQETPSPYRITASSFTALEVKLNVKMHKSQVNDLIFLDEHVPQSHIKQKASELSNKANLPLVCSVSNDNWIKIYSLHERSVFRSHNVANFSLSSVDCVQIWKSSGLGDENAEQPLDEEESTNQAEDDFVGSSFESVESASSATGPLSSFESTNSDIKFTQTLLFLSCWDNSIYVYDMNYNRCIYQVEDSHDDAISRLALIKIPASRSFLLVTSSWDSSIKIWLTSPISKPRSHKQRSSSLSSSMFDQNFKLQFLNELSHDSAVLDFCLTRTHLASICEDGDVLLWRLNSTPKTHPEEGGEFDEENKEDEEYEREAPFKLCGRFARLPTQPSLETTFSFQYTIEHTNEMGKITDCRIIESSSLATLAICTSLGFVKIFNISTASELFSIRISVPGLSSSSYAKLNRLVYTNDYILAIDSNGYLYFVDLQQQGGISTSTSTPASKSTTSSFLSHHIKLTASSLTSIAVYNDFIIACGDSDGYLHFLSLLDI